MSEKITSHNMRIYIERVLSMPEDDAYVLNSHPAWMDDALAIIKMFKTVMFKANIARVEAEAEYSKKVEELGLTCFNLAHENAELKAVIEKNQTNY